MEVSVEVLASFPDGGVGRYMGASTYSVPSFSKSMYKLTAGSEIHEDLEIQEDVRESKHYLWTPSKNLFVPQYLEALKWNSGDRAKGFLPWIYVPPTQLPPKESPLIPKDTSDVILASTISKRMLEIDTLLKDKQEDDPDVPLLEEEYTVLGCRLRAIPTVRIYQESYSFVGDSTAPLMASGSRSFSTLAARAPARIRHDTAKDYQMLCAHLNALIAKAEQEQDEEQSELLWEEVARVGWRIKESSQHGK